MFRFACDAAARGYGIGEESWIKIQEALHILESAFRSTGLSLSAPGAVKAYLRLRYAGAEREIFCVLYLDSQNRLIAAEDLFAGTLAQTSVYPREVVKGALAHNAAAVILAHNHPSGTAEPSRADEALTQTLKTALACIDVKVLDHFVVTAHEAASFAEKGLL
jgi:DNA repair protein RadC